MHQGPSETTWRSCLIPALLHGLMFVLAFPPYDVWAMILFSIVPLSVMAVRTTDRRAAFVSTWVAGFVVFLWVNRWMWEVASFGYVILAVYQGAFPALFVLLLSRLRPREGRPVLPGVSNTWLVPFLWVGLEMLRGAVLGGGYPWFLVAHPLINVPVLCQGADLFGTYFLSFAIAMFAGLFTDWLTTPLVVQGRFSRAIRFNGTAFLLLLVFLMGYGWYRMRPVGDGPSVTIAAVQTNLPQSNKVGWPIEDQIRDFHRFAERTRILAARDPATGVEADLIVWPETMVGGMGVNIEAVQAMRRFEMRTGLTLTPGTMFHDELVRLTNELGVPVLVGSGAIDGLSLEVIDEPGAAHLRIHTDFQARYNSALLFSPGGEEAPQRYDKLHLTPFGEIMPYVHRWPEVQNWLLSLAAQGMRFDMTPGRAPKRLTVSLSEGGPLKSIQIATPICFESTMPGVCRRLVWAGEGRADVLVNLTNDGWFGDMEGGREQHLQIGRFRAIENRVPMVRSANTGISAAIDSAGRILQFGPNHPRDIEPAWSEGVMIASVALDGRWTLYSVVGDAVGWGCLVCLALLAVAAWRGRSGA